MRKVFLTVAAAASALAVATPAAAQYYSAPPPPGYGQGYNHGYNGYGYDNRYGAVRSLQVRVDRLQQRIARFDARDRITEREARRLRDESRDIERRLRKSARNGLNPREYASINYRVQRLEQRIFRDVRDGNRYGYNDRRDNWQDRDRDGRNDRWEDDRGYRHD
jgi:cell division protein FtsB